MSGGNDSAKNVNDSDASSAPQNAGPQVNQPQPMRRDWGTITVPVGVSLLCIGLLMALLLPAVQNAREDGRRMVCQNNIRNVGLLITLHESMRGSYPGYRDSVTINNPINVSGVTTN